MLNYHGMLVPGPFLIWDIPTAFLYNIEEGGCPLFNAIVPILTSGDVSSGLDSGYAFCRPVVIGDINFHQLEDWTEYPSV